jgi:hypothetical protein
MIGERSHPGLGPRVMAPSPDRKPDGVVLKGYTNAERRAYYRARTLFSGKIIIGDGSVSPDCVIRNLSIAGARVRISRSIELPGVVGLLVIKEGLLFDATVIWRNGEETGLTFSGHHDLRRDTDPSRKIVRMLWDELRPR